MQHRIQQHGRVAVRQHESVTVPPVRIARIELKHVAPQHFGDVRHAHGRARMARIRLLDRIHGQGSNGVGKVAAGGHRQTSCLTDVTEDRARIVPDEPPAGNTGMSALRGLTTERVHTNAVCLCITRLSAVMTQFTVAAGCFATISSHANSTNHRPTPLRQRRRQIARSRDRSEFACRARRCVCARAELRGGAGHRRFGAGRQVRLSALSQHFRQPQKTRAVHSRQSRRAGGHAQRTERRAVPDLRQP